MPKQLPAYWLFFGAEYYNDPKFCKSEALGPQTRLLPVKTGNRRSKTNGLNRLVSFVQGRFSRSARATQPRTRDKKLAFKRMNCVATHLPNELEQIKASLGIKPEWLNFSYYTIEDFQSDQCEKFIKRDQLILGNSATASNNHLEALSVLKNLKYKGKIICPLNYGDNTYRESIEISANKIFPTTFTSLTDYLPLALYNKQIAESSVMIMNHYRQQGLGNIITALWYGTRVFISARSPVLSYFRKIGCIIHSIEDDLYSSEQLKPLTESEKQTNRAILSDAYARETFISSIQKMDAKLNK